MAPFSDVMKLVQFSLGKPEHFFFEQCVSGSHSPSCSCDSYGGFWKNFLRLPREGELGS